MFNILKFYNTVKLTAYTNSIIAYKAAPVTKTAKAFPEWIKSVDKTGKIDEFSLGDTATMTACTGFIELYKKGVVIPSWSDIRLQVGKQGSDFYRWATPNKDGEVQVHPQSQRGEFADELMYQHFKLCPPWVLHSESTCDWLWLPTPYSNKELPEYTTLTGVMNYQNHYEANVNVLVERKPEDSIITIPVNTPLAQVVPLTEKKLILETKLISQEEFDLRRASNLSHATFSSANRVKSKSKCPFNGV